VKTGVVRSIGEARKLRDVLEPVLPRLEEVERFLTHELEHALPLVREVTSWVLGSGGKRLRPSLVLLTSRMFGYSGERDVRYGAVVELIHTATLIHDDIIDKSDLRRGRVTANRRWGTQLAVLVGDWVYTRAMSLCLELGDVEVMRRLTAATLQMTEGEIMAERVRGRADVGEGLYLEITRRKTAELFAAACALPALFQPSTLHLTETLLELGRDLGMCFQLVDDLLDYTGSRAELGKPAMADLLEGRVTLPMILLYPRLDAERRAGVEEILATGAFGRLEEGELLEMVRTSGVLEEARARAAEYSASAVRRAERLPAGPEREGLVLAASLLLERRS
jgi:octaprenyl-diphosphate synthase